jgi:hypothetical protein
MTTSISFARIVRVRASEEVRHAPNIRAINRMGSQLERSGTNVVLTVRYLLIRA